MKRTQIFILLVVILFGFGLRMYRIHDVPRGMLVDEPNLGYNAYSILETGKDEFGTSYPLSFKSFGDYKFPAYIYASVLPIKILGLTTFAVRIVSILSGTLLILAMFLLLREFEFSYAHSLLGALITAVSPWTIILSRFAWESNLALLLFSTGLVFLVRAYKKTKPYALILAGLFFALASYSYAPYRVIPFMLLGLFSIYYIYQYKKKAVKPLALLLISFSVLMLPALPTIFSKEGAARMRQTSIFTKSNIRDEIIADRTDCANELPPLLCYVNINKPLTYARVITYHFIDMFSFNFLFQEGEEAQFLTVDHFGLFPIVLIPFYVLGLLSLFTKADDKKRFLLLFTIVGFCIAGLPSAIASSPQRIQLSALYPFLLLVIVGGVGVFSTKIKFRYTTWMLSALLVVSSIFYMFSYVYVHAWKHQGNWAYLEQISIFMGTQDEKTEIYIKPFFASPITYYAFYNKVDPTFYQKNVKLERPSDDGFAHAIQLGNIHVTHDADTIAMCKLQNKPDAIFITNERVEIPEGEIVPKKIWKSSNGVLDLAFAYEIRDIIPLCLGTQNGLK